MSIPHRSGWCVFLLVTILSGCDEVGLGGCEHIYQEPLFRVGSVTDARTGAALAAVSLTDIEIDGHAVTGLGMLTGPPAAGVHVTGDTLVCATGCGFATQPGLYAFEASAPGYAPRAMAMRGAYRHFDGGCPSRNWGSTTLEVTLIPSSE